MDPAAIGPVVGLCHCPSCNVYACRWCWADADGACPRCDFPRAITIKPSVGGGIRLGPKIPRRRERRVPIAAGALVVVAAVLALTVGGWFRPTGAVLSVTDQPAGTTTADSSTAPLTSTSPSDGTVTPTDPTSPGIGTPLPTDSAVPGQTASAGSTAPPPAAHATPTPPPGATPKPPTQPPTARPTATPTPPGSTATPTPPGSTPTPAPTAAPTPTPTAAPTPTPDPTPTPVCHTVPDLVGMTVGAARSAWTAAGFTGSFLPLGQTNKIVLTQSQTPGDCIPADSSISVTFA